MKSNLIKFPRQRSPGAKRLRRLICASGLTQEAAAALAGLDARHLRRVLSGERHCKWVELVAKLEELAEQKGRKAA